MMLHSYALTIAVLFISLSIAIPWVGPMPTPAGLMATAGVSLRPTDAPGLNGLPKELRKRQLTVQYPPPNNWCGFVNGDYGDILSCGAALTCAIDGTAIGCCPNTFGYCDALYTTCYNWGDTCGGSCQKNNAILKCSDSLFPFCGTYYFGISTRLYNCKSTVMLPATVEFLADYYITAIGSTLASSSALAFVTGPSSSTSYSSSSSSGISPAAIGGIAAGIGTVVCILFAIFAFVCVRRRKRRRIAASQANGPVFTQQQPQMQQEQVFPQKFETAYQPVPQQDQSPQYPTTSNTQAGYYTPPQPHDSTYGAYAGKLPHTAASSSPPPPTSNEPRFSVLSSNNPYPSNVSEVDDITQHHNPHAQPGLAGDFNNVNKRPVSPTITEVDGRTTASTPGVISPMQTGNQSQTGYMGAHQQAALGTQYPQRGAEMEGQGQTHGHVYEVAANQPWLGPHEMGPQQ